jgi:hypothetical protein
MNFSVWIGFDRREAAAFAVAQHSARRRCTFPVPIFGVELNRLREQGLYTRPTKRQSIGGGSSTVLWDEISGAPMSTEFALSRFLVPQLAGEEGWAVFMDSDVLVRSSLARLFEMADRTKAIQVVKHGQLGPGGEKMDGQVQTAYRRKNWSSVMLFNLAHPALKALSPDYVNSARGLALHQFDWLDDDLIGTLPGEWNWLVGHSPDVVDPAIVHFTDGFPLMPGYENQPYADEWEAELRLWASAR